MALTDGERANFDTLQRAHDAGDLCLVECTDAKTGERVPVVCAVNYRADDPDGAYELVPLARFFTGNPYDEVHPPTV